MAKKKEKRQVRMERKVHLFRGKTLEELKTLDVRESAKFMKSRPRRSVLRNFDTIEKFIKRCEKKLAKNKKLKTHQRDLVIAPQLVGLTIGIHNGRNFQEIPITVEMIGHRLGEFAPTRVKATHTSMGLGATKSSRAKKK